jgi:magnesium transporter
MGHPVREFRQGEKMQPDTDAADTLARTLEQLKEAVAIGELGMIPALLSGLHPAEIADVMESLPQEQRTLLWNELAPATRGEVLLELHGEARNRIVKEAGAAELIAAVRRLQGDELADLDAHLPQEIVDGALRAMDEDRRNRYQQVRTFPDDTAGGLMDVDAVAVREDVSLSLVMRYLRLLRQRWGQMPEHMDSVVVIDDSGRYSGLLRLSDLVSADPARTVAEIMVTDVAPIPADTPAQMVARLFENRDLISAPVTDADGRVIGRITVDDIVDVIRAEGEHRALRPAGLSGETDIFAPVTVSVKPRALWLGVHLVGAFAAAAVVGLFQASIEQLVALAVLMPVVATMGGVAGNQTVTLVTRGLALRQVDRSNAARMLAKELAVAALNGALWAVVVAAIALAWFGNFYLGAIFGFAMLATLLVAALSGALIPVAMSRIGIDPAVAGGVVVTAIADVMGFLVFLGLATVLLI